MKKKLLCGLWGVFLLASSLSAAANILPGPIPKLPGGLDPDDLDPACLQACMEEYADNWRRCGWPGLVCKHMAYLEFEACVGNCITDF